MKCSVRVFFSFVVLGAAGRSGAGAIGIGACCRRRRHARCPPFAFRETRGPLLVIARVAIALRCTALPEVGGDMLWHHKFRKPGSAQAQGDYFWFDEDNRKPM